jgi:predicted transcriptional regulator
MIDYSYPCMMAEKALKDLHNAAIEGRLDDAMEHALQAITEARMVYQALQHMKSAR